MTREETMATRKRGTKRSLRQVKRALVAADKQLVTMINRLQALQQVVKDAANDIPGGGGDMTNRPPT